MAYYALYDLQINGFKAGMARDSYKEVLSAGAERVYDLSQGDEEPCPDNWTDEEILENYGYEVLEVSFDTYIKINESDEYGLTTAVTL